MISLEVFINGENINLCKPDKDFALNSDWYNWFNDPKNTKFLEQGIKKNTREDQLKFFLSIKNRLLLIIQDKIILFSLYKILGYLLHFLTSVKIFQVDFLKSFYCNM